MTSSRGVPRTWADPGPCRFLVVQLFIGAGNLNPKYLEMLELENFRSSNMSW